MKRLNTLLPGLIFCSLSLVARADSLGLQAGLWEITTLNQTVDGKTVPPMASKLREQQQQMEKNMAAMPPAQRARMQAIMSRMQSVISPDGKIRLCITPAMAANPATFVNPQGTATHCPPAQTSHQGNQTLFSFACSSHGVTTSGHGSSIISSNSVHTNMDMLTRDAHGQHTSHNESLMTRISSSCGSVPVLNPATHAM